MVCNFLVECLFWAELLLISSSSADLNSAIAPHDHRITALQTAISEFDHDQVYKHDEELDLHADKILFQKLAFAFQVDRSSEEIAMICTALEMIYRASRPRVALSFAELRESVLPIFVEMLGKPLYLRKKEALDAALRTQAEQQGTQKVVYHDGSDAGLYRSGESISLHSGRSGTYHAAPSDNPYNMSVRSAAGDDALYQSHRSVNKPYKPQPDEASYMSYDEDSLKKPSKYLDDDQSYRVYDDESMIERSHNQSAHAPPSSVNDSSQGDVYQSIDEEDQSDNQANQNLHQDVDDIDYQRDDQPYRTSELHDITYQDELRHTRAHDHDVQPNDQSCEDNGQDLLPDNATGQFDLPDDLTYDTYEHDVATGDRIYETDEHRVQRDARTCTTEDRTLQPNENTLTTYNSVAEDRSIQSCDPDPVEECSLANQSMTYGDSRSDAEQTYHDGQGEHPAGVCWSPKVYDNGMHGEEMAPDVQETDQGGADEVAFEVSQNQGWASADRPADATLCVGGADKVALVVTHNRDGISADRPTDDASLYVPHAPDNDQSVAMESQYTEDSYHSEGQPPKSTMYKNEANTFDDEKSVNDHSFQSHSDTSHQPSSQQRAFDGNCAPTTDHVTCDPSQAEGSAQFYNQDQRYVSDSRAKNGFCNTDETSQYSGDVSMLKPGEESFEVETVYSEEGDDQSRDSSLVSKASLTKKSDLSVGIEEPLKYALAGVGGLSTVAEDVYDESSASMSSQSSLHKPKAFNATGYSQPPLPTIDDDDTIHSSRTSISASARAMKHSKMENEREISNQIAILEAEVEFIRAEDTANPVGVSRTLQVLRYFSRVLSAMVPMAHHPGLLDALVYQLERQAYGRHADQFNHYDDGEPRAEADKEELASARVDAIATIVNLACAEDNKAKMAIHPGLLDAITTVAQCDPSEEAREHAAIVIMNLAYEDENKELMVQHEHMLETLAKLIQDCSPFTRRYASAALFTLACVVGNTEKMAEFCDGEILECLRRVLADDPVDEARINAAEALFNMARNNTEETLQIMGDHPKLLATLAKAVLTDYSADARIFCARALEWMAVGIHFPMECHRFLLSALTVSSQWTKTSCIAEAMKTQASLAENRVPMASHDGLLQAVANLALMESLTDLEVRKSAIATLEMISHADEARQYMVANEYVMRALTKASFERHGDEEYAGNDQGTSVTPQSLKQALRQLASEM